MQVISLNKGEEVVINDPAIVEFWLTSIVKEDDSVIVKDKPSTPSEFSIKDPLRCNYNYDGTTPTITFNTETRKLKATGWGYKTISLVFN